MLVPSVILWGVNELWNSDGIQNALVRSGLVPGDCPAMCEIADKGRAMSRLWKLPEKALGSI